MAIPRPVPATASSRDAAEAPAISIVVVTIQGWPTIRNEFATWQAAASSAGGELILVDGSGRSAPPPDELTPTTRWLAEPGASVFQLRARGYDEARGPIVATTEDHCRVSPDWAVRWLEAFREHPAAIAVGGSVENGATSSALDWASYFVVQASSVPPIATGRVSRIAGAVNVAYQREALAALDRNDGLGVIDGLHQHALARAGAELRADDSIRVVHDQSMSWAAWSAIHFHAGRTYTGFLRRRMDRAAWLRVVLLPLIPYARLANGLRIATTRGHANVVVRAWPAMLWLLLCQSAGQLIGFLTGPRGSPRQIQ